MKAFSENAFMASMRKRKNRPTISDVAAMAGVSISTVSRVLNGTAPVANDTYERVYSAIEKLRYRPHTAAQTLASQKTNTIGILLPVISGSYFPPMLRGVEHGVRERGYELLIHATSRQVPSKDHPPTLGEHNTDGLLIFTDSTSDQEIQRLYELGFPLVLLHRSPPHSLKIPMVTVENKGGSRSLINYLIEIRGHRRIGFLRGPEGNEDSYWREMGYREALQTHQISIDPALIAHGGFNGDEAAVAVRSWLAAGTKLDAIYAGDDDAAAGVLTTLRQAGIRVPEDIAVVGFDDAPLSRYLSPALTTVRAPIEIAGHEAARQLISLIETGKAEPFTLLPTELVIRRSCGADA
jgi:DNA-binding LacI/PurR family transcriptional regulator